MVEPISSILSRHPATRLTSSSPSSPRIRGRSSRLLSSFLPGLVTAEWLHQHLDDADLAILDVRGEVAKGEVQSDGSQATEYRALFGDYVDGHIPGAAFVDWTKDIAHTDPKTGVAVQLLSAKAFLPLMESKGVGLGKRVVVYDNGNLLFATRMWWALRLYGHQAVAILDGGWNRWLAEDRPVSQDAPCPLKVNEMWESDTVATSVLKESLPTPFLSSRVESDWVLQTCVEGKNKDASASIQIIDARSREQYLGRVSRSLRGGHIPHAISIPYKSLLGPPIEVPETQLSYQLLQGPEQLEQTLRAAGVIIPADEEEKKPVTCVYCNGGVASTVVIFVLNQLYGLPTHNYDGSWNEWGKREDLPLERKN